MLARLSNRVALLLSISLLLPINFGSTLAQSKAKPAPARRLPGKTAAGMLLPNGWTLTPEGQQIPVSDLPMNMELSKDGRYLLVTTNGNGDQTINVIDLTANASVQSIKVKKSWLGLDFAPDGKRFYVSGGDDNEVMVYDFAAGRATEAGKINLGSSEYHKLDDRGRAEARRKGAGEYAFPAGIAVSPDGRRLYVAENLSNKVAVVDLAGASEWERDNAQGWGKVIAKIEVGEYPYDCEMSKDGKRLYVSDWGSRSISVIDPASNAVVGKIQTGDHPNDLELTRDGKTLYVANANSNTVSVIDTAQMKEIEAISTALHPKSPAGSTPNAVALSPDEKTLYIANADNNDIAVIDLKTRGKSEVEGFIPTGWYPTSIRVSKDGRRIFVANGKGVASAANPKGPNPYKVRTAETEYSGSLLKGTVSLINKPTKARLAQLTRQTYKNSPYTDALLKAAKAPRERTAVPFRLGDASPIKHVIYIVKENRTYDQVLGDMKEGNGEASLCLFGEDVTPNQHAIAREFVLLDNFYVDAEVSADGHNWSMAAYATDYVEKTWPTNYSQRGRTYDYEGQKKISAPTMGYIWDHCKRAGVSYRSYGEFISTREGKPGGGGELGGDPGKAAKENYTNEAALEGHFSPTFPSWDLTIPDNVRVDAWLKEFREYEKTGDLPQFQVVRIGGDHTQGTRVGQPTPRAHVAENDLAVGRLVEAVSSSERYWKDTAVFIIEDDAQNGPDHVDAHRSIAFVVSPYTKRNFVDSTMYTTSGMLRTMELILGIPPMSQYDAAATPMFNSFTNKADLKPFKHRPAQIDLAEKNAPRAAGSERSAQLDFTKEDAAPDIEFNEIIWKSVRGPHSQMPAPVRSAFVRAVADNDDDDGDKKEEREERREARHKTRRTR